MHTKVCYDRILLTCRGGRVVEGTRLESVRTATYRRFESCPLRQTEDKGASCALLHVSDFGHLRLVNSLVLAFERVRSVTLLLGLEDSIFVNLPQNTNKAWALFFMCCLVFLIKHNTCKLYIILMEEL